MQSVSYPDSLAERAYKEIRSAIFSQQIPSGSSLSVPKLARELSISRSPVREAVQRLVSEGIAITVPHKGAVVASIGIDHLIRLYEVREMLEGLAARRATEHLDDGARDELRRLLEEHRLVLDKDQGLTAHMDSDMRFHRYVRELADNEYLAESLEMLQGKISLAMHSLWPVESAPWLALQDHERIAAAMLDREPEAAESAARQHIARLRSLLIHEAEDPANHGNYESADTRS